MNKDGRIANLGEAIRTGVSSTIGKDARIISSWF